MRVVGERAGGGTAEGSIQCLWAPTRFQAHLHLGHIDCLYKLLCFTDDGLRWTLSQEGSR